MNSGNAHLSSQEPTVALDNRNRSILQKFCETEAYQTVEAITSGETPLGSVMTNFIMQNSDFDTSTYAPDSIQDELVLLGFSPHNKLAGMVIQAAKQSNGLEILPTVIKSEPDTIFMYEHHDTEDHCYKERLITREEIVANLQQVIIRCFAELACRLENGTNKFDTSMPNNRGIEYNGIIYYDHWKVADVTMTTAKVNKEYGYWSELKEVKAERVSKKTLRDVVCGPADIINEQGYRGAPAELENLHHAATIAVQTAVQIINLLKGQSDHFAVHTGTQQLKALLADVPDLSSLEQDLATLLQSIDIQNDLDKEGLEDGDFYANY